MRLVAEATAGIVILAAVGFALAAHVPHRVETIHPPTRADLALQGAVWSPIGIRARWCARQDTCRPINLRKTP